MLNLLLIIAILFVAARVFGWLAERFGAPRVVGEIVAGLVIAPFRAHVPLDLDAQTSLSAILIFAGTAFLFVAGFEIDLTYLKRNLRSALSIGSAGLIVPALCGVSLVFFMPEPFVEKLFGGDEVPTWKLAAMLATVLAISAVPVIAKTLSDLGLLGTRVGTLTISSALFDDLLGWIAVTIVIGSADVWTSLLLGSIAVGAVVRHFSDRRDWGDVGAFKFVRLVLAPIYFASLGWRIDFFEFFDFELVSIVLIVGLASKWFACALAAKLSGLENRESWSIGAAMTSRGAMGIVFATAARDARVISAELHVALIALAVISSLVSGPVIRRLMRESPHLEKGLEKWQPE
ncbi:MAG: cation:proton antiporter [Bdellovibrionota bacterium]